MKDFKGTKGEWIAENRQSDQMLHIHSENGLRVCEVKSFGASEIFTDPSTKEADENAKLIAAAPNLLIAAQKALEAIKQYVKDGYIMKGTLAENKLKEAINKALGQ